MVGSFRILNAGFGEGQTRKKLVGMTDSRAMLPVLWKNHGLIPKWNTDNPGASIRPSPAAGRPTVCTSQVKKRPYPSAPRLEPANCHIDESSLSARNCMSMGPVPRPFDASLTAVTVQKSSTGTNPRESGYESFHRQIENRESEQQFLIVAQISERYVAFEWGFPYFCQSCRHHK
jgi:hypothetical protein